MIKSYGRIMLINHYIIVIKAIFPAYHDEKRRCRVISIWWHDGFRESLHGS